MQAIARELNNSETAFVFRASAADHDHQVRFFTPSCEVPVCGHATLAAHYVLAYEKHLQSCVLRMKCAAGIFPINVVAENGDYRIHMQQQPPRFMGTPSSSLMGQVCQALGLSPDDLDPRCPPQIVTTGHGKLLIGVQTGKTLDSLRPNMMRLAELSPSIGANGYFIFTLDAREPGILAEARMFAPAIGISEDPVTGNGNGPLGAYVVKHGLVPHDGKELSFAVRQGQAMARPGTARVRVTIKSGEPVAVSVGDEAVVVFRTSIRL
jgi:PhzF family phenazine biosynthesis protein